jgi:hypothetical protein
MSSNFFIVRAENTERFNELSLFLSHNGAKNLSILNHKKYLYMKINGLDFSFLNILKDKGFSVEKDNIIS